MQHFPDLKEIIAKKRRIRRRQQRYKEFGDKVELYRLTNFIHDKFANFEADVQEANDSGNT